MNSYSIGGAVAWAGDSPIASLSNAIAKLDRISRYRDGWAYGEGVAFQETTVALARSLLQVSGVPMDVFPSRDGHITVAFYVGDDSYDFIVGPSPTIRVVHESEDGEEREIPFAKVIGLLTRFYKA